MKALPGPGLTIGAWYGLMALTVATLLANLVNEVPILIAEPMKHDLLLSDIQIGALRGGAITLTTALAAFPIGWLADRIDRRKLYALCILIWSVAVSASGFAGSYSLLFFCWLGVALGEGAINPVTFSIIPDLVPRRRLLFANSVFFITQLLGVAAGLWIGGALLASMGTWKSSFPTALAGLADWRLTLVALGLPGPFVALMILLMPAMRSPKPADGVSRINYVSSTELIAFIKVHRWTLLPIFIGFGLIAGGNTALFGWVAIALVRFFGETPAEVGMRLAPIFAVAGISGVVLGGLIVRLIRRRFAERAAVKAAQFYGSLLVATTTLYLFAESATQVYTILGIQVLVSMATLVLGPTTVQSITPAAMRGRMFAVTGFFYVGYLALAPLLIGGISDALGPAPRNLIFAMIGVTLPSIAIGVVLLMMSERTLGRTLEAVRIADAEKSSMNLDVRPAGPIWKTDDANG